MSLAGWSGSSEQAKCDQRPVTTTRPARSAFTAASMRSAQCSRAAPPRESPVSNFSCTRATVSVAAAISSSWSAVYAVTSMSASIAGA